MSTLYNAISSDTAPTMPGTNIALVSIPVASFVSALLVGSSNQSWTGINTLSQQPIMSFTTDPGANSNLFYGYLSGTAITSGVRNTGYGNQNSKALTSGSDNTTLGNCNTIGTTTSNNTFLSQTNAGNNAAFSGSDNTIIGNVSTSITSGSGNTGLSRLSLQTLTTGNNNSVVGQSSGVGATNSNSTTIGTGCVVAASNLVGFGNTATAIYFPGTSTTNGAVQFSSSVLENVVAQAPTTGSNATFNQTHQGDLYKKVVILLSGLNGSASYDYPTSFDNVPVVITTANATGGGTQSVAASVITVAGNLDTNNVTVTTVTPTTGILILEGY